MLLAMAVYAIGDVQGCFRDLRTLLDLIKFDPPRDQVWFVGDLVNRGPRSLSVLRFVKGLGDSAVTVLGNHDLHLLAASESVRRTRPKDTFTDVLLAPDCDELLDWLRHRPLLHRDRGLDFVMVHAGLPPQWSIEDAERHAQRVSRGLADSSYRELLRRMYGNEPDRWSDRLGGWKRIRFIINALTRLRYCRPDGSIVLEPTGSPDPDNSKLIPWFAVPERKSAGSRIIFGHWSTLQLRRELDPAHGVYHLDTGCVWGGSLSALRLDDRSIFSVPCSDRAAT